MLKKFLFKDAGAGRYLYALGGIANPLNVGEPFTTLTYPVAPGSWTAASASYHGLAIRNDGTLWAWGLNNQYQLGLSGQVIDQGYRGSPVQVGNQTWTKISTGTSHSLAIRSDGTLWAWGDGGQGALGTGNTSDQPSPVQIGTSSWTVTSVGQFVSMAIRSDGALFSWGNNLYGVLGDDTEINRNSPVQLGTSSWSYVSAGYQHAAAIRSDGKLFIWGLNNAGQLGLSNVGVFYSSPVQVGASNWTAVECGVSYTLAIRSDGALFAWGLNTSGQLGDGTLTNKSSPVQIGTSSWIAVAAAASTAVAIRADRTLWGWGTTISGCIPFTDSVVQNISSPVQIGTSSWTMINAHAVDHGIIGITTAGRMYQWGSAALYGGRFPDASWARSYWGSDGNDSQWKQVVTTPSHTIGIKQDGTMWALGLNNIGQLGTGDILNIGSFVQIGTSSWNMVSAGTSHTTAIRSDGALFAWGYNGTGEIGDGTVVNKSSPVQIGTSSWAFVDSGWNFNYGITVDKKLYAWGLNTNWQLGLDEGPYLSPVAIVSPTSWKTVACGNYHAMGIKTNGSLWAWGLGTAGRLGNGAGTGNFPSPVQIGASSWVAVSCGSSHTAAIDTVGRLFTWGLGTSGQLGDSTVVTKSSPVQVGTSSWSSVTCGIQETFAIDKAGRLFAWGYNDQWNLGIGLSSANQSSPVQIGTSSWIAVAAGSRFALAIDVNKRLFAWGLNGYGQMGQNTQALDTTTTQTLIQTGGESWIALARGDYHTLGIKSDYTLWAWGYNVQGQLGNNSNLGAISPVQIGTSSWIAVAAGDRLSAAIRLGGSLFTWGLNNVGQLGDSTTVSKSSPVQIGTSSWTMVSAGRSVMAAIDVNKRLFTWGLGTSGVLGLGSTTSYSSPVQVGTSSWNMVSCERNATSGSAGLHMAAIRADGALFAWGLNQYGQLGDETTVNKSSPVQIGTSSWAAVAVGYLNTGAIRSDGKLFMWGFNGDGEVGDLSQGLVNKSSPQQVGTSNWSKLAIGNATVAGIMTNGRLYAWGNAGAPGLLTADASTPTVVGTSSWTILNAGLRGFGIVRTDGRLFVTGNGDYGDFGSANVGPYHSPVQVGTSSWNFISADSSGSHVFGIKPDGSLWGWGLNTSGQLGDGTITTRLSPVQIGASSWMSVNAGGTHTLARTVEQKLFAWGAGLGVGDLYNANRSSPVQIGVGSTFIDTGSSLSYSAAIRSDNRLYMWGLNDYGQCGTDAVPGHRSSPVQIGVGESFVVASAGVSHGAAITTTGKLYTVGSQPAGQLGIGDNAPRPMFVQVGSSSWTAVSCGRSHTLAVRSDRKLFGWGLGSSGQIGDDYLPLSSPVLIGADTGSLKWTAIADGGTHALSLREDGSLWVWGQNNVGQLGTGDINTVWSPIQLGTESWAAVSAGNSWSIAIKADGTLWTWGRGTSGVLGLGSTTNYSSPVQVGTSSWLTVTAGNLSAYAIDINNRLFAWGEGSTGELAQGVAGDVYSPVQIAAGRSFAAVEAGVNHALALEFTETPGLYTLWAWGGNQYGQHAQADLTSRSSIVQIGTGLWKKIGYVGPNSYTCYAQAEDGTFWAWGLNDYNQLATGDYIWRSSPVVLSTGSWTCVAGDRYNTYAINATTGEMRSWGRGANGMVANRRLIGDNTVEGFNILKTYDDETSVSWAVVKASSSFAHAIDSNGRLWGWGAGPSSVGQSGYGTPPYPTAGLQYSPVQIGTRDWKAVTAAWVHSYGIDYEGYLWFWGNNEFKQFGNDSIINSNIGAPTLVNGMKWASISSNYRAAVGLANQYDPPKGTS